MPISEDEFNQYSNDSIPSTTMSKAELRKTHKPIMEKRRRAKINNCLNEIKHLILVAMKKDPERHSKLEKADILEMAVKHLKTVQRQQKEYAIRTDPTVAYKYKSGFVECAEEVSSYVNQLEDIDSGMKQRLVTHLTKCATNVEHKPPQFPFASAFAPSSSLLASFAQNRYPKISSTTDDHNTSARIEVIPSCLPTGEFAFLVPKSSFSSILSSQLGEERQSAFVTVTPSSKPYSDGLLKISRPLSPPASPTSSEDVRRNYFRPTPLKHDAKITSTTTTNHNQQEIHNIKFPIQKKDNSVEPLCIITNSSERYRYAQVLDETCRNEENVYNKGVKRRFREDSNQGLLALANHEPPKKLFKIEVDFEAPSSSQDFKREKEKDGAGEGSSKNDSMWRPW